MTDFITQDKRHGCEHCDLSQAFPNQRAQERRPSRRDFHVALKETGEGGVGSQSEAYGLLNMGDEN